jgi:phosphoribosylglycinamide formyltransferase 1
MKRIVILISGRGSNMEAIVQRCAAEGWPARVAAVVSNRADARRPGLCRGARHRHGGGRPPRLRVARGLRRRAGRGDRCHAPDLVVLAGFMRILGDGLRRRYAGRLLNIHPSLLPAFPGLHTHRRALEAGCKLAGATVHFVTPSWTTGRSSLQAAVPVRPTTTTSDTLAARVLATEHRDLPAGPALVRRGPAARRRRPRRAATQLLRRGASC